MKRAIFCTGIIGFCAACGAGTLTFAPGNGQTTNVAEMVGGTYDSVQINSGASGGGIVNLLNPFSLFSGAPTVDCGTLAVKDLRPIGQPSALGRGAPGDATPGTDPAAGEEGSVFQAISHAVQHGQEKTTDAPSRIPQEIQAGRFAKILWLSGDYPFEEEAFLPEESTVFLCSPDLQTIGDRYTVSFTPDEITEVCRAIQV